jgi:hypothetical protein
MQEMKFWFVSKSGRDRWVAGESIVGTPRVHLTVSSHGAENNIEQSFPDAPEQSQK